MSNPDRIVSALERIADALEAQNAADPLTMLSMAMGDEAAGEPAPPFATNGITYVYQHPADGYHIVARPNPHAEGGYRVEVEPA